jgi:hypothetical protein
MITIEKLNEYEKYHGYYDGFYMQKVKNGTNITTNDEWRLIGDLLQDIWITRNKLASNEFSEKLNERLKKNCDSKETINKFLSLSNNKW